jgi:glycogen debranching enzyme
MTKTKRPYWITTGLIFIVAVALALIFIPRNTQDKIHVGLLMAENQAQNQEMQAVNDYLNRHDFLEHQSLEIGEIGKIKELKDYDVIWYHQVDSADLPAEITSKQVSGLLKQYVEQGGKLLLTMEAMKYLPDLGLENEAPSSARVEAFDHGFGRKRGLHAYRHHPVFQGLNGGSYIFSPKVDTTTRLIGYFGDKVPQNAKVVAVDWAYINLAEDKKLMLEYSPGKGKVMGIGAYTLFSMNNYHREHLEMFMNNVLGYMNGAVKGEKHYWNYEKKVVEPFTAEASKVETGNGKSWKETQWGLKFEHTATSNFFDVAGERMVIMGKEKGGIDEIWTHPFMGLRDYQAGYRTGKDDSIHWLSHQTPRIKVTPNAFQREYSVEGGTLKEVIVTDIKDPVGALHYEYSGDRPLELFVRFHSNLRLMWPYSSKVIGSIRHSWNENLNAFVFTDESNDFVCMVGSDKKPKQQLHGQYSNLSVKGNKLTGDKSDAFAAGAMAQFALEPDESMNIVIGATNQGLEKTFSAYRPYIKDTEKIRRNSSQYYQDLLADKLMIESPDPVFNEAYKWALIGTDRFYVHTPGLGKSLVAGYGTSESGWRGGHKVSGRPGYAWYFGRDGQWSGFAVDGYGDFEKVRNILETYIKYQDLNGKIYHELTTSGAVHYDASDATPLFVVLAGHYMRHSGDVSFVEENWEPIKKAMDFCYSTDRNNDHLIENTGVGHGWVEGGHLFGGRSTLYLSGCWAAALEEASGMAQALDKKQLSKQYRQESKKVTQIINQQFWDQQRQFFSHSLMPDGSYLRDITIMPAIPLYYRQIEDEKSAPVLERFATNNFSSDWGVRIIPKDNERFNPRGYHTGSVWPLYTGWTALAEYKNNRPLQGYMHTMNNLWVYKDWAKGFVEEVLNGQQYLPGGVCAHQCWSETMGLQPLYEGMLGYTPKAQENTLTLAPAFPVHWDSLRIKNLQMGSHNIQVQMQKTPEGTRYTFTQSEAGEVEVQFQPYLAAGSNIQGIQVNGVEADFQTEQNAAGVQPHLSFALKAKATILIRHTRGIGVIPIEYKPKPGDTSNGIRIVSAELNGKTYHITLQGPADQAKKFRLSTGNYRIKQVRKATIVASDKGITTLETTFPQNVEGDYATREVILELKPQQ